MAYASSLGEDAAISGVTALTDYLSGDTNSGGPGTSTTQTAEVSGGSYARQSITWASASGGSQASNDSQSMPIPASTTVYGFGLCSASSGSGNYYLGGLLTSSQTFSTAGTLSFAIGAVTVSAT